MDPNDGNRYQFIRRLGEGAYASVFLAKDKETDQEYAIKVLEDFTTIDEVSREINILSSCQHENIVHYYRTIHHNNQLWIVMDYCAGGSLRDFIDRCELTLSERHIAFVMACLVDALKYLHARGIIHRDLKAGNILLKKDGTPKIADFGVSKEVTTASKRNTVIGTPLWMSPEAIQGIPYNSKTDIWSLGITAIELADGAPPHADIHPMKAMFKIPFCPPPTVDNPSEFSELFNDFVAKCLVKDPSARPSAEDLSTHPFIVNARADPHVLLEVVERFAECSQNDPDGLSGSSHSSRVATASSTGVTEEYNDTMRVLNDSASSTMNWGTAVINDSLTNSEAPVFTGVALDNTRPTAAPNELPIPTIEEPPRPASPAGEPADLRQLRRRTTGPGFKALEFTSFSTSSTTLKKIDATTPPKPSSPEASAASTTTASATTAAAAAASTTEDPTTPYLPPTTPHRARFSIYLPQERTLDWRDVALVVLSSYVILHWCGLVD